LSTSERIAPYLAGTVASVTGSVATFGIVIAGLSAMGANQSQISTALVVMLIGYGALSIILSIWLRKPISVVWSTPGAAFLGSSVLLGVSFEQAVGAFLLSSFLLLLTGLWPWLGELVGKIPPQISAAMLAGVIFPFAIATVHAAIDFPPLIVPVLLVWFTLNRFVPVWASPVAISLGFVLIALSPEAADYSVGDWLPDFLPVIPVWDLGIMVAIGVPLYLITMASQNLPGLAIMSSLGFPLPTRKALTATGLGSVLTSLFGGLGLNLAAITAALNADSSAAKDPARRWIASSWGGVVYLLFAVFAAPFAGFVLAVPRELLLALAGLALLNTFSGSIRTAVEKDSLRLAGVVTFLIGAAGITILGIGGAFWALVAGLVIWLVQKSAPSK
jgi:benzoate membrane transport protein